VPILILAFTIAPDRLRETVTPIAAQGLSRVGLDWHCGLKTRTDENSALDPEHLRRTEQVTVPESLPAVIGPKCLTGTIAEQRQGQL
jgi:hypothetical protein